MASNSFGNEFRITTWGESHGNAIGVVIDGCPSGLFVDEKIINQTLALRAPGRNEAVSPRKESDKVEILSGIFENRTTGAPISLVIWNQDADSSKYESIKDQLRPGHANYTYEQKYGVFDYRGGGRASARETACRVAAGAIAQLLLDRSGIQVIAYIRSIGEIDAEISSHSMEELEQLTLESPLFCPDPEATQEMLKEISRVKSEGDSLGGVVEFCAAPMLVGLGDPVYQKLEAQLAQAMLSIPATKGFEIGDGFTLSRMRGSEANDTFQNIDGKISTRTNHAGGTLGGISSGMPLVGRVAFKPTSSILKPQDSINHAGEAVKFQLPEGSRHDPCVAIRGVPVVQAMIRLVLADFLLRQMRVRFQKGETHDVAH